MRIHAIETGTVAIRTRQREGKGHGFLRLVNTLLDPNWTEPLPIYAWVIEHPEGLIVVDTGETARANEPGYFPAWHPYFKLGVRENVTAEQEIGPRMRALGLSPKDVRWVILTHLHTDHAGGLSHFPQAEICVSRQEYNATSGIAGRLRGYLNNRWPDWFSPRLLDFRSELVGPFPQSLTLTRAGDVVLVPTPGHSIGHLSVILRESESHLFIAGDASYTQELMCRQAIDGVAPREALAQKTLGRIADYVGRQPTVYLPSHDPEAEQRLINRLPAMPSAW